MDFQHHLMGDFEMASLLLLLGQGFAATLVFISLFIIFTSFRNFFGGLGKTILLSYLLFFIYNILEIIIMTRDNLQLARRISTVSVIVLATAYYLLHLFHDEISASYRQRKTMTLASIIYGLVVGGAFFDHALNIDPVTHGPYVNPIYGMLIVGQATLAIHRITTHIIVMSKLSDHYGIKSNISTSTRILVQRLLLASLGIGIFLMLFVQDVLSLPFAIITAIGILVLAILYKVDPISSIPIAQQIKAISLISGEQMKYYYIFSDDVKTFVDQEDFASLVTNLSKLYVDIVQSETKVTSIDTGDYLFMFEPAGDNEYLLLIVERKAPFVRTILQSLSTYVLFNDITNQIEFTQAVQKQLLYPNS